MENGYIYFSLIILLFLTLLTKVGRDVLWKRSGPDWILDSLSLLNHFFLIPLLQILITIPILHFLIPDLKATIHIGWGGAILANMIIDYGWYWNHRLLHSRTRLWSLHAVHHEPQELDIFKTPRNTLWSPLFMVYFWLIPLFIYLAQDPFPFLAITGVSLLINFWGHTQLNFPEGTMMRKACESFLIQPKDHFWHHSSEKTYCNFGTVYNFWDRIHGTWHKSVEVPQKIGFQLNYSLIKKIFLPES